MMTRGEARRQRKEIERQIAADLKQKARRKLEELAAAVKSARAARRARVRDARFACTRSRRLVAQRIKDRRARLLRELAEVAKQEREAARGRCDAGKARAREAASTVERARAVLLEEREYQRALKRIEANNRSQRRNVIRASRTERRAESDDEVISNLDAELVPLWERVKGKIRGSSRRSRTEAFLEYAHNHPDEIIDAQDDGTDRVIRDLEAKMREVKPYTRSRRYTAAELAAVPF